MPARAETTELIVYYPISVEVDRYHARKGTVGTVYSPTIVSTSAIGDGNLLIAGQVGIGTPSPLRRMDVIASNSARFFGTTGSENGVYLVPTSIAAGRSGLAIGYNQTYNGTAMTNAGFLQAETQGTGYRTLLLNPLGGFVGVATAAPLSPLHVRDTTSGSEPSLFIALDSGSPGAGPPRLGLVDTSLGGGSVMVAPSWVIDTVDDKFRIGSQTNITSSPTAYLRILNNGNIGIGIDYDPTVRLEMAASSNTVLLATSDSVTTESVYIKNTVNLPISAWSPNLYGIRAFGETGIYAYSPHENGLGVMGDASDTGLFASGGLFGASVTAMNDVGLYTYAPQSGSSACLAHGRTYDFYANGPGEDYPNPSSIRWKNDIQPMENILEKTLQIRGVAFRWDEEHGGRRDIGFIGEEVGRIFPEVVHYEPDGEHVRSIDYSKMTPILIVAFQELEKEVSELETRLKALRNIKKQKKMNEGRVS